MIVTYGTSPDFPERKEGVRVTWDEIVEERQKRWAELERRTKREAEREARIEENEETGRLSISLDKIESCLNEMSESMDNFYKAFSELKKLLE